MKSFVFGMTILALVGFAMSSLAAESESEYDDPVPYVIDKPAPERSGARLLGIGWTVAGGTTIGDRSFAEQKQPTWDIGAEVRLFPRDDFSINFLFDIGEAVGESIMIARWTAFHFRTLFNYHGPNTVGAYFSAAPYVGFRAYSRSGSSVGALDVGGRVGVEIPNREYTFAMGVYGRPGFQLIENYLGTMGKTFEIVIELTWSGYVQEPADTPEP
jgi:hypothetical protein